MALAVGRLRKRWRELALFALLLTPARELRAADAQLAEEVTIASARTLADSAADAVAAGDYFKAEQLLARAYQAYPAPTIALLHARTLAHLNRLASALTAYERAAYTSLRPDAPEVFRSAVQSAQAELEQLRPRVPRLLVVARGESALLPIHVTVDGHALPREQLGRWLFVDPGQRVVQAELSGARSQQVVRVDEGQWLSVELHEPPSAGLAHQAARFGALGLGVVGLAAGISTGLAATAAYDRAEQGCPGRRCAPGSAGAEDLEEFRRYRVFSTIGYVTAGAGLGVAGYLFARSAVDGPALSVQLQHRGAWLAVRGTL